MNQQNHEQITLNKFEQLLGPSKSGNFRCPAHDDHNPSMSVKIRDGKLLTHCHANCSPKQVKERLMELGLIKKIPTKNRKIKEIYRYKNENGLTVYEVIRYEPKGFNFRRPEKPGKYIERVRS